MSASHADALTLALARQVDQHREDPEVGFVTGRQGTPGEDRPDDLWTAGSVMTSRSPIALFDRVAARSAVGCGA